MFVFFKNWFKKKTENGFQFIDFPPASIELNPDLLDIVQPVVKKIESALTNNYKDKLFRNYKTKNPQISIQELEWRLHELKKYFFLTTVFKHVPMYSKMVDELWHEMILFTREYNQFCGHLGVKIEHEPHLEPKFNPDERAFFDFMYSSFFQVDEAATHFYGEFFQYPLSENFRNMLEQDDQDGFLNEFIRDSEQSKEIATKLWEVVTKQIREASPSSEDANTNSHQFNPVANYAYWMPTWFLLGATNPDKEKSDGGAAVFPGDNDSSDSSGSSCSSCSGCGS